MKSLVEFLTEAKKVDIQNLLNKNPKDIYIDGEDLVIGDKTVAEFWDDGGIDFPKGTDPEVAKAVIDQWIKNTGDDWPEEGDIYIMIDGKEINEKQKSSKANLNENLDKTTLTNAAKIAVAGYIFYPTDKNGGRTNNSDIIIIAKDNIYKIFDEIDIKDVPQIEREAMKKYKLGFRCNTEEEAKKKDPKMLTYAEAYQKYPEIKNSMYESLKLNESNDIPKILKQLLKKYKKADDVYQDGSDLVFGMEGHTVAELSDDGGVIFPEGTDPDDAIAVVKLWTSKKSKVRPTYDDIEYIMVGDTEIKK